MMYHFFPDHSDYHIIYFSNTYMWRVKIAHSSFEVWLPQIKWTLNARHPLGVMPSNFILLLSLNSIVFPRHFIWIFPAIIYLNFFPPLYLNYYNITCVTGTPFIRWSIVIYCLISRAISFACSVWIRVIRCCIKLPHFISRNSVPSSVWTFLVEITWIKKKM